MEKGSQEVVRVRKIGVPGIPVQGGLGGDEPLFKPIPVRFVSDLQLDPYVCQVGFNEFQLSLRYF